MNKRESISKYIYYGIIILLPLLLAISFKNVANVLPLLFIIALALTFQCPDKETIKNPVVYLFLAFLLYAMLSTLWAHSPGAALERTIKILLLLMPAVYLLIISHPAQRIKPATMLNLTLTGFLIACGLIAWQLSQELLIKDIITSQFSPVNFYIDLNPAVTCFSVIYWPILLLIQKSNYKQKTKIYLGVVLTLALLLILYLGKTDTARVAAFIGAAGYFWIRLGGNNLFLKLFVGLSVFGVISASSVLYERLPIKDYQLDTGNPYLLKIFETSHLHRLEIWDRCLELIYERPLFGWGMDSSYHLPESKVPSKVLEGATRDYFLYPHNAFIQSWLEFGIIGLMLMLFWINALFDRLQCLPRPTSAACVAALMAIITVYSFGFPLWRSWWIVFLCVIAIYFNVLLSPADSSSKK